MKALLTSIILLFSFALAKPLPGQVVCPCQPVIYLTPDPADPCCYFLNIDFSNSPGCGSVTNFNQITINTAVFGGSGIITGATAIAPSFSATINSPTLVTFSTTPNFIPALPAIYVVGQVCFDNNSVAFFPGQMVISNGPMDNCAVTSFQDDLTTICGPSSPCDSLFLVDTSVCTIDKSLLMPLYGCSNIPCMTLVKWYVQSPCGIGPFVLYQVKPDCDLLLFPYQFSTDICVYAEVITDGSCNCPILTTTDTAKIYLCDPVSCSILNPTPELCDCDTPMPLSVNLSGVLANCPHTVSWYDGLGVLVGNTPTYAPPLLCFQGPPTDCYQDYVYKAIIDSPCGKDSCFASIRVYNDNAPMGNLVMNPFENQPFCPGEDATLEFTPGCAGDPKTWKWYSAPCTGSPLTYLADAGLMNPEYNTNKLYQSTWYYVETKNGVCLADTVPLKIEVKEPLSIISFSAVADPCVEQQVNLSLDFAPCTIQGCGTSCNCTHTVDWYKDGFIVGSSAGVSPIAAFTYFGPPPLAGNYYAVLKDDCCPGDSIISTLIKIEPTCFPLIKGPCFMCNGLPVVLEGEMILPPRDPCPSISLCTFEWYELVGANEIFLNNQTQFLLATHPGIYIFESDCNGCLRRDTFYLAGCNNPCSCGLLAWADFYQAWNFSTPIDDQTLVQAPCPKAGQDYFIHGDFSCAQASCGGSQVDWVLTRPSPLPPVSGSTNISPYPHFDIFLPWSDCVEPGIYTLTITRYCGVVPCSYIFEFEVPNCGCLCSDLAADGGLGFGTGSGVGCIRYFKPYGLDACDVVTWTIDGNLAPGSSIGNNGFGYNFTTLGNGSYTVCMQVTRTPIAGPPCTYTKCQTIIISCNNNPNGLCLADDATKNGNFTEGLVRGHLGNGGGQVADWLLLPELSEGLVFVDDSAGGYDYGYLVLSGGLGNPAGVYQELALAEDAYTNIEYNRRNISGEQLPSGTKLEFSLYSDPEGTDQQLIYSELIGASADTGWVAHSVSVETSPNPDFPYLVVSLNNDAAGTRSVVALDNLDICSSSTPLGASNGDKLSAVFRLFPNPANEEITVEWKGLDIKRGSIQIISSLGQVLRTIPVAEGSHRLTASVAGLPAGIYFVKVVSGRKPMKVMKFIKS